MSSFANFVDAPESSRSSRLAAATVIACSTLALGLAIAFTFERMAILRMPGPKTRFELAAVMIAEPPPVADPPPKPDIEPEQAGAGGPVDDTPMLRRTEPTDPEIAEIADPLVDGGSDLDRPSGIPKGGSGLPCPGGICAKGPIGIPGPGIGTGTCKGLKCEAGPSLAKAPPPKPLPLSSLGCLACADPNEDALRRTAAGIRKTAGTNVTRFCVDTSGRVEAGSVVTDESHGDAAIDRLCRDAVKAWRFTPTKVDGEARRACSEASFRIRFE